MRFASATLCDQYTRPRHSLSPFDIDLAPLGMPAVAQFIRSLLQIAHRHLHVDPARSCALSVSSVP